ncbi:MAG: putative Ig domain-containing protein [Planctomycetes bacterium]|nr:putative Ig domain-containing protein [Planctomycetota bacterium]
MNKNSPARIASILILFALASVPAFMTSCDGGGGGGGTGIGGVVGPQQSAYDIQITGPATNGAQVNRPFSLTVNFLAPGTATPINVISIESLVVTKLSGPGSLTGTLQLSGNGTSSLTFNNLILDTQGAYTLQVNGARATAPAVSATFNVGPQMDLKFTVLPTGTVYRPRTFSVTVGTVDPGTQAAVTPTSPIDITIVRNPASGTGTLGGTTTRTLTGTSTVAFPGLTYSVNESVSLQASAFGFASVLSNAITFDSLVLANPTVSASPLINGNFSITCGINSATTSTPVAISPAISVSVAVASGGGTLSGTTTGTSSGSSVTVSGLRYSNAGPATFTVSSTEATSVTTGAVTFGVSLTVTASGPTTVAPGGTPGPFVFSVRDGQGALYTGAVSQLAWALVNTVSAVTVQSGNATFTGGNANVTLAAIATSGSYRLDGSITSPTATPNPATINITVNAFTQTDAPGPFLALKSVRVGSSYVDNVTFACLAGTTTGTAGTFGVLTGNLPAGITLNDSTGALSGTPTTAGAYAFTLYAKQSATVIQPLRCQLDVFSANESEIPATAPDFRSTGTYSVQSFTILPTSSGTPVTNSYLDIEYSVTSTYDNVTRRTAARIWAPLLSSLTAPAPVLVHHHGVGQFFRDYNQMGNHLASYGIITISIEDAHSFAPGSSTPATSTYRSSPITDYNTGPTGYIAGMLSAGGFSEVTKDLMELLNQAATGTISGTMLSGYTSSATLTSPSAAPFVGKVDPLKVFMSGHSRGAGATQYAQTRFLTSKIRGVILFSPYDLRHNNVTTAGGGPYSTTDSAAYSNPSSWNFSIPALTNAIPRLPCLNFAYEEDGDLFYPIADQIGDRAVGPLTNVTVFGANHNYTCDTHANESGSVYISRAEQQLRNWQLVVAFIKRWTEADGRYLDGMLYCNQFVNGTTDRSHAGITAWRNMTERLMIDDFQDGNTATNSLGGANSLAGASRSELSAYPAFQNLANIGIKHNIITLTSGASGTYSTQFNSQNVSAHRRLAMAFGQTTLFGYDWVTVRVRLTDASSATSTVTVFDRTSPNTTYLPDYNGAQPYYDRFVDLQVALSAFSGVNLTTITKIEVILESDSTTGGTRQVYFDNIRFE